jgi:hypothetical protein
MAGPIITDSKGVDRLWPYAASKNRHVQSLEMSFRTALTAKRVIENHEASVRATGKLTDRGVVDEVRNFGRGNIVPSLAKAAVAVQRARDAVTAKRSQLTAPALDKADAVSFLKRESIRDSIRNMPRGQRDELLVRNLDKLSAQVLQAVLEDEVLPWVQEADKLVSDQTRDAISLQLIRTTHPAAIVELAELERAIEYAEPTIATAAKEVQSFLAMGVGEFASAVDAEAAADPVKSELPAIPPPVAASAEPPQISPEMEELWKKFDMLAATVRYQ